MAREPKDGDAATSVGVAPGALSALLRQLAEPPDEAPGAGTTSVAPGTVIGRFELVREIGRGGFGVVWEARDRELGRTVAFKFVRAGERASLLKEQLHREAEAAARLSHDNIVALFDVGQSEHGPYLVLEHLRGRTLAEWLALGPVEPRLALRMFREIVQGVAHAHAHGVVHRDLKPANVFVCVDGRVKVLDFGLAHAFGQRRLSGGTPAYMAPEQWAEAPEDERTDVFALGVMLHEMLTGRPPSPGNGRRARERAEASRIEVPGVPALGALAARMLDRSPVNRPADAGKVLAALEGVERDLERVGPHAPLRPRAVGLLEGLGRPPVRSVLLGAALGLVPAVLAVGWYAWHHRAWRAEELAPAVPAASIAVLPFADMSEKRDQEYFADGVAEEILNALAHVEGIKVIGRTSSHAFKGKGEDLGDIGRKLGVAHVLEGSVRRSGGRVRVTAQLIKVSDASHVWSEGYDRRVDDIFAVQDEIAHAVVGMLKGKLLAGREPAPRSARSTSPEAYAEYLRGRTEVEVARAAGQALPTAALERAVAIDPAFAPAWAALVDPLVNRVDELQTPGEVEAQFKKALAVAERAVALGPEMAEAYEDRGLVRYCLWDWAGARSDYERGLALNPGSVRGHRRYGVLLGLTGGPAAATGWLTRATELDPLDLRNWVELGRKRLEMEQHVEARRALQRALDLAPAFPSALFFMGYSHLLEGRPEEGLAVYRRSPSERHRLRGEVLTAAALEDRARFSRAMKRLAEESTAVTGRDTLVAQAYTLLGEPDRAFALLEQALAQRDDQLPELVRLDPILRRLRHDPRYRSLLARMNLP